MGDKTEEPSVNTKQVLKDITYKKQKDYKDGQEHTLEYLFSHNIQSYKIDELINKEDERLESFADAVAVNIGLYFENVNTIITEQQKNFYIDCSKLIFSKLKFNNPILIPVKCGFGKSTFIKVLIEMVIKHIGLNFLFDTVHENELPMIITTDRVEDLEQIQKYIKTHCKNYRTTAYFSNEKQDSVINETPFVYVMKSWNKKIDCKNGVKSYYESIERCNEENCPYFNECEIGRQHTEQIYSPILAITNKRLANLLNNSDLEKGINKYRKFIDKDGNEQNRNILIIDEKPKIAEPKQVLISTVSMLITQVDKLITGNDEEKREINTLIDELNRVSAIFIEVRKEYIECRNAFIVLNDKGFSSQFMDLWHKYFKYRWRESIDNINDILINGGLFCNPAGSQYFYTTSSNKFNTDDLKTFIFDGTAELSLEYAGHENSFIFLNIDDYKDFKNLKFWVIDENYSKESIENNPEKLNVVAKWINNNFESDLFVISYNICKKGKEEIKVNEILSKLLEFNFFVIKDESTNKLSYFGNTKGKNTWSSCENMIQIGWNRYNSDAYFAEFLATNEVIKSKIKEKYDDLKYNQAEILFGVDKYGKFVFDDLEQFRLLKMAVDLEQEVYRTKIRDFGDTESNVTVYLFKASDAMRSILSQRFKGCDIRNSYGIDEFREFNKINRVGNDDIEKILEWIDNVLVKLNIKKVPSKDVKTQLDISDKRWQYLFNRDNEFINILKKRRVKQKKYSNKMYIIKY